MSTLPLGDDEVMSAPPIGNEEGVSGPPFHHKKVRQQHWPKTKKEEIEAIARALRAQPLREISTTGLQYLQENLGLLSESPNIGIIDAIFIAIDFEFSHHSAKTGRIRLREVGISTFDTRQFPYKQPEKLICSRHYRTVTDTKEFLFGKTIDIEQDALVDLLRDLLMPEQKNNRKPLRKLILLGHGFSFEIKALRGLGINLALSPMVENILDTHFLGIEVFGQDFNLKSLTRKVGIEGTRFHNAGNDACYSMRAMLLLAIQNLSDGGDSPQQSNAEKFKRMARV